MTHWFRKPPAVIFAAFLILCLSSSLFAIEYSGDDRYSVAAGDTIFDDLALAANECAIDGVVMHDLMIACKNYTISGDVGGSIMSASMYATIRGSVGNSARIFAQNVNVDGEIGNNLVVFGAEIDIGRSSTIGQDAVFFGGVVRIYGDIDGNLTVHGEDVTISGLVNGDVYIEGKDIFIDKQAQINGNITYKSAKEMEIDDGASIAGEIEWKKRTPEEKKETSSGAAWAFDIILALCSLVTGLILLALFKRHTNMAVKAVQKNALLAIGVGFVGLCITPVAVIILLFTIIGIPAAILTTFAYVAFFYLGKIYVAIALGKFGIKVFKKDSEPKNGWCLVLGLFIMTIVFNIPVIGWIAYLAAVFAGFGATVLAIRECREMIKAGAVSE